MKQQRAPYAIVSDETWELVRAAYLSGLSASVVAARFGVTVWGLRKRAAREGWTKMAHAKARDANRRAVEAGVIRCHRRSRSPILAPKRLFVRRSRGPGGR